MTISQDLRIRLVHRVADGASRRQAAAHFDVSVSSAIRFAHQYDREGSVAPKVRKPYKRRLDAYGDDILGWIADEPDMTLHELSERLSEEHGVRAPKSTIDDWLRSRNISFKKTAHASEQARADVQAARAVWRKRLSWLLAHPEKIGNLVFIDETGINTKMARLRGRCLKGQRMVASIPHGHWKSMTFIAGLRSDRLTAPWVIEGAMNGDAFEHYIKTQLVPTLKKGDVVVLDNLAAHKRKEAAEAIEERGAWLLFLPPYSPDLNPIELAFSKFKAHIKRIKPRTIDELWKAAGTVCDLFKSEECRNYFIADGYASE